jgi:malonate-semialdehyde dehydrogenase (acetylating)/methylmalonate-semialdehyde dehydrogenase
VINISSEVLECQNLVGGKWVRASGKVVNVLCPYNGAKIGFVHESSAKDVNTAVLAAQSAAKDWARVALRDRCEIMFRFREILLRDLESISQVIASESGKTLAEAKAGLLKGVEVTEFALSLQNVDLGGKMQVSAGVFCEIRREPLGVVAGITPFNFPAMVPLWMIPIAITLGNAFVWKPSDKTPLTSFFIAKALEEAGLPAGVLSIVHGGKETVEAVLDHPGISAAAFVGSTPVAKAVYQRGCSHGKRVLALGGAKNHIFLLPDADVAMAAKGISDSFTGCAGQRCMAASVLLAVGKVDSIVDEIVALSQKHHVGKSMGAIISRESLVRQQKAIERALAEGANLRLDGRDPSVPEQFKDGNWLGATILDNVKAGQNAATEELFGPILTIVRCKTLSEALAIENACEYGNAASIFTASGDAAERIASEARAGMIGVNVGLPVPREPFSFGGIQSSKFGHGDITGRSSLDFWSDLKKVTTKWAPLKESNWMS